MQAQQDHHHTKVTVQHNCSLELVKSELRDKQGVQNKCLRFKLSGLRGADFQGILFSNDRAIGKLCSPTVCFTPVEDPAESAASTAVHQCSLAFESWVPAGSGSGPSQPLRIPIDSGFEQAELSVQVIGRQSSDGVGGTSSSSSFALPHRYSVHGKELAAKLQVELQRQDYIRKHQEARRPPSGFGPVRSCVTLESGNEVERLLSVFDVAERPAWLRSLVCKFLVAESPAPAVEPTAAQPPRAASGPSTLPHVVDSGDSRGTEGVAGAAASSSSSAASSTGSEQAQQQEVHGRQKGDSGSSLVAGGKHPAFQKEEHQHQGAGGEGAASDAPSPPATATSQSEAHTQEQGAASKRTKKRKAKPSRMQAEQAQQQQQQQQQGDAGSPRSDSQAEHELPESHDVSGLAGQQGPSDSPAQRSSQGRGRGQHQQHRRAHRATTRSPTGALAKQRRVHHRAAEWEESIRPAHALPPPPGLHLQQQPQQHQEPSDQAGPGPGSRPSGRRSRQLLAAAAQTRWARRQLGGGAHGGAVPGSHGSSSDVSSEVASSARPSSAGEVSPRSSSPATEAAGPDAASPRVPEAAASRVQANGSIPGPLTRQRTLDTPAALRLLTEALLPQERPWQRAGSRGTAGSPAQGGSSSSGGIGSQEERLGSFIEQQPAVAVPEHQLAGAVPEQQQPGSGALLEPSLQQPGAGAFLEEQPGSDAALEPSAAGEALEQQVQQPASDASLQDPPEQQHTKRESGWQAPQPAQHQQKPWQEARGGGLGEQCLTNGGVEAARQLDLPQPQLPSPAPAGWAVDSDGVQSSPMSSAPSTPRSGFLAASGSLEYPSSTTSSQAPWDSPRRQYGMPYHFGVSASHAAQLSPDMSSSSFQKGYQEHKSHKPYGGRLHTQHQWQHGDAGSESSSGWSHQHSRLGPPVSLHPGPGVGGRQPRMSASPWESGASTAVSPTWQQRQQHEEGHRRSYSSPTMASMMAGGLWNGSPFTSGHPGAQPANGTYPAAYQHRSQPPYAQVQTQQAGLLSNGPMQGSLGHPSDARSPHHHHRQQQRQSYDPGYQQQQSWQQQKAHQTPLPQQHWPDGLPNGYTRAHSRSSSYGGGDAALYSAACSSPVGQSWQSVQHQQLDRLRQWHPSSSASTSRAPSLAASPLVQRTPVPAHQQQQLSAAALPPHQPVPHMGEPADQLPLQLQVADSMEDSPDLERLLQAVTPAVVPPGGDFAEMTLADVWRFYEVPSMFGQEVVTLGGPRGPAASYYLPYLSAVQLFCSGAEPATGTSNSALASTDVGSSGSAAQHPLPPSQQPPQQQQPVFSFPGGLEEWPEHMHLQYQWFAGGHVGERVPLGPHLDVLCGSSEPASAARDSSHPLLATRIADLHPYSWFSVAWYPVMRIPEAPLDARFLTYHSLASLWDLACEARAQRDVQASTAASANAPAGAASPPPVQPCSCHLEVNPFAHAATGSVPGAQVVSSSNPGGAASSSTPTGVCSFPASPTCSDSCTRTTTGGSAMHTSAGAATAATSRPGGVCSLHSVGSDPRSELGSAQWASTNHSGSLTPPSPSPVESVLEEGVDSLRGQGSGGLEAQAAEAEAVSVPVVGLQWYSFAKSVEVWTETLVAAQLPEDMLPSPGTLLADGSRVMGCWRGVAVVAKPYPAAKGGAMAWEVHLEELAETAGRLATGAGLQCRLPDGRLVPAGVRCPDHDFFASRAWTCKSSAAAAAARWGGGSGHVGGAASGAPSPDYHHPHQHHHGTYRG